MLPSSPCYVRFCQWKYLEYNIPHTVSCGLTTPPLWCDHAPFICVHINPLLCNSIPLSGIHLHLFIHVRIHLHYSHFSLYPLPSLSSPSLPSLSSPLPHLSPPHLSPLPPPLPHLSPLPPSHFCRYRYRTSVFTGSLVGEGLEKCLVAERMTLAKCEQCLVLYAHTH